QRLRESAIESEIDLRHLCRSREAPFIRGVVAPERPNVIEGPRLAAHHPIPAGEIGIDRIFSLRLEDRFVEAGRQHIAEIDIAREFAVLLAGHSGRNEDSQVPYRLMDRIDDRLSVRSDLVDILVEVENPPQCLLRRRDVVSLRAEDDDRRAYVAKVEGGTVRGSYAARCKIVADEQLADDELDLLGVEADVAAPPTLEIEIARSFAVDLGVQIVLFAPQGIRRIEILEILHQPGAVELAVANVAGECREPA